MASVQFDNASRRYPGSERSAVDRLSLDIADGEFLVLVGPSGCGKSTSLRMLAGLEAIDDGAICIGGHDVSFLPPKDRDVAMVFQNYALYPHMTVAQNMSWALKIARRPKAEIKQRVTEAAQLLGLEDLLDRRPRTLSGGQRQRVAMGRAIVRDPQVFLMDEPLSNLDAQLRSQMRGEIASLQRRLGVTTVYVTHDQIEAMTMGDRVAVLADGVLQQVGTPSELYDRPANVFIAGFIGSPAMSRIEVPFDGNVIRAAGCEWAVSSVKRDELTDREATVILGVRPEDFRIVAPGGGLPVRVAAVEEFGADAYLHGQTLLASGSTSTIVVRLDGRGQLPRPGAEVCVAPDLARVHLFSPATGRRLN